MTNEQKLASLSGSRRGGGTAYQPGSVVGDYVVIGAVGSGGMGTVYKVQHAITQRIEAMKLLASGRTDPEQEQRFVREMQVQARLHHPNIAAVYNAFRYYDEFFLVLEFVDGESLETVLQRGRLPLATGIHFALQALFALGYAHAHGVVHRDIATSNMIIAPDGTLKLTDFGLAKTATDIRLTHSGAPVGSPWYMSPEQVRGDAALDARSDIYSLGVVLYEMATGAKPFDLASTFDVMRAQVEMAPMAPIQRTPELPHALNSIILTALAKDPKARFQSAEQFYTALDALQSPAVHAPGPAAAKTSHRPAGARSVVPLRPPRTKFELPRFARLPVVQTALGTAACGLALFGGYATYSVLRVTSAAEAPVLLPARAEIPQAPLVVMTQPDPLARETVVPPGEPDLPPPVIRVRKPLVRPSAPLAVAHAIPILPAPPERTVHTELESLKPHADPAPATAAVVPVIPRPPVIPEVTASAVVPEIPAELSPASRPIDPADTPAPQTKKDGNRFLKAWHKVNPFHNK